MLSGWALIVLWAAIGWVVGGLLSVSAVTLIRARLALADVEPCLTCESTPPLDFLRAAYRRDAGVCPACGEPRREAWPVLELVTSIAFGLCAWRFGWGWQLAVFVPFVALLALIALIDIRHRLILDVLTMPAIALAFPLSLATVGLYRAALGGLVAGGTFLALYLIAGIVYRQTGALGLGDVKLALLIGLVMGAESAVAAVVYSVLAGGLMAIVLLLAGRGRSATMPYGPNLAIGAFLAILLSPPVWN